ncbi:MAG: hypothetical protein RLY31_1866 [Bacteroidota bacterium]
MTMGRYILFFTALSVVTVACGLETHRKQGFSVHGIDVSHYQRHIDWDRVAEQDIRFVFVKASEGETLRDSFFDRNWRAAKSAGIRRGAYHFFRPSAAADRQAANFMGTHDPSEGDLPPVLDVEVTDGVDAERLRQGMARWLSLVETRYRVRPLIYTNQQFYNRYLADHFHRYPIWIARYSSWREPFLRQGRDWHFWQYGNKGRLDGIRGPVDLNVFNGAESELEKYLVRSYRTPDMLSEDAASDDGKSFTGKP